ncbi:hypothetical protein [Gluconacetobacter tumulicola]|uniref:Uncharacterized protein n=1 Tax=Gluconacetobacter tumulicola TaxID=1017177 RepID=A0A7W4JFH4_9PROT|nr:hypothetical protein [Gluconacetobacter tumulicola]MBB2180124.1 hypothetical protein [Gluconacetobacter tumulicola]
MPTLTLFDQIMQAGRAFVHNGLDMSPHKLTAEIQGRMRSAARYTVSANAVQAAVDMSMQRPDILAGMLGTARAPSRLTWIEWSPRDEVIAHGREPYHDTPDAIGYLIEQVSDTQYIAGFIGINDGVIIPSLVSYLWDSAAPLTAQLRDTTKIIELMLPDVFKWPTGESVSIGEVIAGEAYSHWVNKAETDKEGEFRRKIRDDFISHVHIVFNPILRNSIWRNVDARKNLMERMISAELKEIVGSWTLLISMLGLLHTRDNHKGVEINDINRRGKSGGTRSVPLMSYRTIHIKNREEVIRDLIRQSASRMNGPRRLHNVMGHWRHYEKEGAENCQHAYVAESPNREVCVFCGSWQTWIAEHKRGDANLGHVVSNHAIDSF